MIVIIFFLKPIPSYYTIGTGALSQRLADAVTASENFIHYKNPYQRVTVTGSDSNDLTPITISGIDSPYAFATFLAGSPDGAGKEQNEDKEDHYFNAVRLLTYQLLHAKATRNRDLSIPFIVLVTELVPQWQQDRMRQDGAVVIQVPDLSADWVKADSPAWDHVMTKLRLWQLTQFERICFLDADNILLAPLDGVFSDPALVERLTSSNIDGIKEDEAALPPYYVFASLPEMMHEHGYPPTDDHHDFPNSNYLNVGFFAFKPCLQTLQYYASVLSLEQRFHPSLPEQNLINYAHRRDGNMPWSQLDVAWNIHYPVIGDIEGGVKSIHEKYWEDHGEEVNRIMKRWRWQMEGFYEARDQLKVQARHP